jgi:Cu+-exporting ATPase
MSTLQLTIDGMTCASCVRRVENALKKVPGVTDAQVNLAARRASVEVNNKSMSDTLTDSLVAAVKKVGYESELQDSAAPVSSQQDKSKAEVDALTRQFWMAALLTLPVFIMEMGSHLIPNFRLFLDASLPVTVQYTIQAVLTTLVLAIPGRHFFTHGLKALFNAQPEMNSLVALGAGAAWLYSMVVLLLPALVPESARFVYFEAAAVIVTLILLGRLFEARAKGNTGAAIERLIGLQPQHARLVTDSGEQDVPIDSVNPGDTLRVRPGEKIPVDGEILTGEPFIDQSMITGEPVPAHLKPGESVAGGTINTTVGFTFKATHTGTDTVLAGIIRMVQSAQNTKLPIQALVDRVTAVFVPVIMGIALITFLTWYLLTQEVNHALVSAVAVLIIACPCAMGLATPTSIMVGTGRAAQLGILFRQGDALQQLKHIQTIAFDKTGTLTQGRPTLTHIQSLTPEYDDQALTAIVASLQQQSEHPIAKAIVNAATEQGLTLPVATAFEAVKGFGITAEVNYPATAKDADAGAQTQTKSMRVAVGSEALMQSLNISTMQESGKNDMAVVDQWAQEGATPIHIAIDGQLVGLMAVTDPIKPEARAVIAELQARNIRCAMVTGDHQLTAQAVAKSLNLDIVHAQVKPEQKVQVIEELMQKNTPNAQKLAFVGDGINDAPALATADVGIAIGTGTDVAIEAASVVLMSGQLSKVITAIDVSKKTLTNIHQNLFWAFAYNAALVPIAAGILYPFNGTLLSPMLAAGAMAFSSVFVVTNALRLRWIHA